MHDSLNILFLGDLCLASWVENLIMNDPGYDPWADIRDLVEDDDIVVANLECCISNRGEPSPDKYANLRADPIVLSKLDRLDVALMGNNHVSDWGEEAAEDTKNHLAAMRINAPGYGSNLADALRPAVLAIHGLRIGILSLCCLSTHASRYAALHSSGVAPLSCVLLKEQMESLRKEVDAIFVCPHWGRELQRYPTLDQMRFARRVVALGADMVVGCHTHVVQPYEQYKGRWIFYGLGNFLFSDIPVTITRPDGSQRQKSASREPVDSESLGLLVGIERRSGRVNISVKHVIPLKYNSGLVPHKCSKAELTYDLRRLNRNLRLGALFKHFELEREGEILYRTEYCNRNFSHFYLSRNVYPVRAIDAVTRPLSLLLRYGRSSAIRFLRQILKPLRQAVAG